MAYTELIKNFERIRDYMREFYVYGFKSRDEYDKKSARSYDNERRRIESYLGEYMGFRQSEKGKNVFLSIDSRSVSHNPLYSVLKSKSFTDGDITLHFILFDILHSPEVALSLSDITAKIDSEYLSSFKICLYDKKRSDFPTASYYLILISLPFTSREDEKNLSKALTLGTVAILAFYVIYYIGLSAFLGNGGTILTDANAPIVVFESIMGKVGGAFFTFFIMVSCLGTVNGLVISCCRGMYTMSCRGQGICPEKFSKLGKNQSVSLLSCIYGFACMILMLVVWYLAMHDVPLFRLLGGMDEIVCALIYGVYITMYIFIIRNFKEYGVFKRYVMPIIAIIGSLFFVICGTGLYQLISNGSFDSLKAFFAFLILFALLMFPCLFFYNEKNVELISDEE